MYCTGGLEPCETDRNESLLVDGTDYIITDKFKTMLRDSLIDWGTFLEVYHDDMNNENIFKQVINLLYVKETKNLKGHMLPLVKKIYDLPANLHMNCMLTQFNIYEPISITIRQLFNTIKHHYEHIVERFIIIRNEFIINNKLHNKSNDWNTLISNWKKSNTKYKLCSSSPILLFLNPSNNMKSGIYYQIDGKEKIIESLKLNIEKFKYNGFCPKVPIKRLHDLLRFPINIFVNVIKDIRPDEKLPDYKGIETMITNILKEHPNKPIIKDDIKRNYPPSSLISEAKLDQKTSSSKVIKEARIKLMNYYVTQILDYRKQLLPYGQEYEEYYLQSAKLINNITEILKKKLIISNISV
jgi:hypothetical protein